MGMRGICVGTPAMCIGTSVYEEGIVLPPPSLTPPSLNSVFCLPTLSLFICDPHLPCISPFTKNVLAYTPQCAKVTLMNKPMCDSNYMYIDKQKQPCSHISHT